MLLEITAQRSAIIPAVRLYNTILLLILKKEFNNK